MEAFRQRGFPSKQLHLRMTDPESQHLSTLSIKDMDGFRSAL